jgi:predicted ferric reductase
MTTKLMGFLSSAQVHRVMLCYVILCYIVVILYANCNYCMCRKSKQKIQILLYTKKSLKEVERGKMFEVNVYRPPLWSSGQTSWLQTQRSRVRLPAQPDFLSSSESGTGSIQPL